MGMVYAEIFKIIFGILLVFILFLINFNLYYLSAETYTDKAPSSQATFITSRLKERRGMSIDTLTDFNTPSLRTEIQTTNRHSDIEAPRPTNVVTPTRVLLRYTEERLYHTVSVDNNDDDDKELYQLPATVSMILGSDEQRIDETQQQLLEDKRITTTTALARSSSHSHSNRSVEQKGYAVVMKIYEQQTMASGNLLQLQCWASYLNIVILKPFMKDSSLLTPLDEEALSKTLKLDDVYDMADWDEHARNKGYAPLIEWDNFLQNAPRDVIIVQMKYPTLTYVKQVRSEGKPFPRVWDGNDKYKEGCKFKMIGKKASQFLMKHDFRIVHQACFNFVTGIELPMKKIHADIFGDYDASKVTVIIDEWRGLGENQRVLVEDEICIEQVPYREHTRPSSKVVSDAQVYANMYLSNGDYNTQQENGAGYIAVIARFEMTGLTRKINSQSDDRHAIIPHCLQQTLNYLDKLKQKSGLRNVFLSFDAGKYGSHSFAQKEYYGHYADLESFVGKVYNGGMNIHEWEKTFETVARTTDSGYIAKLQQVIVTRAKCILFVGGGSFQRHALHLYQQLHPDPTDQCIVVIEKCTSAYRPIQK